MQQLQSYTRDPCALFSSSSSPLRHASRGPQPVLYRDAVFAVDVGTLAAAGTRMHSVTVDWHKGTITAFVDASDAMNGVPVFSCTGMLPACEPHTAEQYVRETFEYLQRGHSLHHGGCRCTPRRRAHELGFTLWGDAEPLQAARGEDPYLAAAEAPGYIDYCTVGTSGQGRSVRDIERELGVRSLYGLIAAGGEMMPLMQVLVRLAGLHLHAEGVLSSPICCVPPEIVTAEHILAAARALYPRALVCGETCFGDLARLKREGALRVLCISDSAPAAVNPSIRLASARYAVFWRPPHYDKRWRRADADIRRLWAAQPPAAAVTPFFVPSAPPPPPPPPSHRPSTALRCYRIAPEAASASEEDEDAKKRRTTTTTTTTPQKKKKKRAPLRLYGARRR